MVQLEAPPGLRENSEVDICIGNALFVAILECTYQERSSLLMDGCVRVGSPVTLRQSGLEMFGRVHRCEALGEGLGYRVSVHAETVP